MSYYGNIDSIEKRKNAVAMLSGDVRQVETLLRQTDGQPFPIVEIQWYDKVYNINSYELSVVLYDALRHDDFQDLFVSRHVQELLDLHKQLCPPMCRIDYGDLDFIQWNDWGDYFEEEETRILLDDGVRQIDIDLTNYGIQHKEKEVVRLLKDCASPYFLNRTDIGINDKGVVYGYFEVAPMLSILENQMYDQWQFHGLSAFNGEVNGLSNDSLECVVFRLFQAAAGSRILYLVDKYITPLARAKGEELMKKYNAYYPMIRFNPNEIEKSDI